MVNSIRDTGTTHSRWRLLSHWYYTSSSQGGATSSAFRSPTVKVHRASMGVDRWGDGGVRPDAISTSLCRLRRLTNECRLEEEQNTRDFPLFKPKSGGGGHFLCGPHQAEKWGDASPPPIPHRSTPMVSGETYVCGGHAVTRIHSRRAELCSTRRHGSARTQTGR